MASVNVAGVTSFLNLTEQRVQQLVKFRPFVLLTVAANTERDQIIDRVAAKSAAKHQMMNL